MGLALATAACGGSPKAGVASLGTTTTVVRTTVPGSAGVSSSGGALVEYARCMRSHGVLSFPEPASLGAPGAIKAFKGQIAQSVGSLASSPRFQAAQRACAKYFGPPTTSSPAVSQKEIQKLLAVSRCIRAHGIPNFPDPNPTTGQLVTPPGIDRRSPIVLAALRACSSLGKAAGLGPPNTGQ